MQKALRNAHRKVLVTGGAGYVGSHAALVLAEQGYDVTILDNFSNSSRDMPWRLSDIAGTQISCIECDLRDARGINRAFAEAHPDVVVHCAGLKAVSESREIPLDYYEINVLGTVALLKAMDRYGCSRIVFSSSASVYGTPHYLPVDESHPLAPESPYGRSKAFNERIIEDWVASRPDSSAVLLRYFNPVGAHDSGEIGESPTNTPTNLMPVIIEVAAGERDRLLIFGSDWNTPDGTGLRDFIHVMDLAEAHAAAIEYAMANVGPQIFNVGTGRGVTVLGLIENFERATGRRVAYTLAPRRAGDVGSCIADATLASRKLGWRAHRDVADMCRTAWQWRTRTAVAPARVDAALVGETWTRQHG